MAMSWESALAELGEPLSEAITSDGYSSAAVFRHAFTQDDSLEAYGRILLLERALAPGVTEANLRFHPKMSALRMLLEAARGPSPSASSESSLGPFFLASGVGSQADLGRRLTPDLLRDLKAEARQAYPTEPWDGADWPCKSLLQTVLTMKHFSCFEWVPWAKCMSEDVDFKKDSSFLSGSPHKIEAVLRTRAIAFAAVKACSFTTWKLWIKRLLQQYTSHPPSPAHMPFSASHAEAAERQGFLEACRLVESGWTLDDALHEIAIYRDRFSVLVHQLRPLGHPLKRPREWEAPDGQPAPSGAPKGKGYWGKGKGKGKEGKSKSDEPCRRFQAGLCTAGDRCKYRHA